MKLMNIIKTTFVALMLTASAAQATLVVSFDPSTTDVSVGDTFPVDVLANADFAGAFLGFDLGFNLDADSITLGSDFVAPGAAIFDVAGFVGSIFPAFPIPISGVDILLATLTFTATTAGDLMLDVNAGSFSGLSFVQFSSEALNITVSEVSAPATLGLFAIALVGLVSIRRKV
jgi:hypothetical protein